MTQASVLRPSFAVGMSLDSVSGSFESFGTRNRTDMMTRLKQISTFLFVPQLCFSHSMDKKGQYEADIIQMESSR